MGQYPELYLLVEPDKLLAGLPLLEDIGLPGTEDWREELESGGSFMLASGRSWLSVSEFVALLPSRLDWLRSVDMPELRLIRGAKRQTANERWDSSLNRATSF
ncbi:hypothetical protein Q0M94_08370 [Deinococcus radiomollis]|uniref:hypothetical protein n=1 Tax=Deinococcus radiomollis TaxID=468916 RepID=UPI003891DC5B